MVEDNYFVKSSNGGLKVSGRSSKQTKVRKIFDECVQEHEDSEKFDADAVGRCVDRSIIETEEKPGGTFKLTRKGKQLLNREGE
jgi:predicted transcriptional regulator